MKNELDVLKQHLGQVQGVSEFKAKQIGSQINDANDFIGALQVLDLALKKIHRHLSERMDDDGVQRRALDAGLVQLINNCSFMGTALFDNVFNVHAGERLFEFEIMNPLWVLENGGYEGVLAYIEDKREEIKANLSELSGALLMEADAGALMLDLTVDFAKFLR
ncbi:flagellar FLiS export co-chaperone [Campylobacter sp.]|uniref:flagellar FLiS export co-chaperone n=1 Tax=Campylobacter sp. TaxID=205 RepID=UPI0026DDC529|nr:flagellar FLiS export co-chaperone [Campylobacter sp.]MDO4673686.1 flagellar FLiS export co-chaperone [Campylobacter sp.]